MMYEIIKIKSRSIDCVINYVEFDNLLLLF